MTAHMHGSFDKAVKVAAKTPQSSDTPADKLNGKPGKLGRKTYEGLAAVWPQLASVPGYEAFADQMNSMPKYVASRTLREPLEWNATLLQGDLASSVADLKDKHGGNLIVSGGGELAHALISQGLVDEVWFTVSPYLWATGPRIFDDIGPVPLELVATTTFPSGVVQLCYRLAPAQV